MSESNSCDKKIEIAGAITFPKSESCEDGIIPEQPKQPKTIQGLLKFAMEATKAEDAPHESHVTPLDDNRRKFLEATINSLAVNVIEILQEKIAILQNAGSLREDGNISNYKLALETILEYVDNIDTANDFHKIGGFSIFLPCFKCINPEIRAGGCDVLAELCQNNPYCQRVVLDTGLLPPLIKILGTDQNEQVCIKALYAISCIVRQNTEGFNQLLQHQGLIVLLKTLQQKNDKLRAKTAFLLSSLCRSQPDLISRLVFLEYVPVLIALLGEERTQSHEHILSLVVMLAEENNGAVHEFKNPKYNFEQILIKHLNIVENKAEFQEEEGYCRQLLNLLFSSSSVTYN